MHNINKRLVQIREESGKSQVEMSKSFNVSKQTYGTIERGTRAIRIDEIEILKNDFNVSPTWLLFDEGDKNYISGKSQKELIDLILDFRSYGGEVNIVKREIVTRILSKLYKKNVGIFIKRAHKYGNRVHFTLISVLNKLKYSGTEASAKNFIRDKIEEFHGNSVFSDSVKKNCMLCWKI